MTAPNPLTYEAALEAMARAMAAYLYNGDEEDGGGHAETVALVLAAAEASGFVLVPKEATDVMCQGAYDAPNPEYGSLRMPFKNYRAIWNAMLEASPPSPGEI